jgi:hypothetical protein
MAAAWNRRAHGVLSGINAWSRRAMNSIIYLIGLIVVILAVLSFFGLA